MSVVKKKKAPFDMYSSEGGKKKHTFFSQITLTNHFSSDDSWG